MLTSLSLNILKNNGFSFKNTPNSQIIKTTSREKENPITKPGERAILLKATIGAAGVAGLQFVRDMILDDDKFSVFKNISKSISQKIISKKENLTEKEIKNIKHKTYIGVILATFGVIAVSYLLNKIPYIKYEGDVNAFKKGKEMDVYIKTNRTETALYDQMNEKAKNSDTEEKEKLREQYMKMRIAKNKVPDFVDSHQIPK